LDPIICERNIAAPGLHDSEIRAKVTVKIRYGEGQVWPSRRIGCLLGACPWNRSKKADSKRNKAEDFAKRFERSEELATGRDRRQDGFRAIHSQGPLVEIKYNTIQSSPMTTPIHFIYPIAPKGVSLGSARFAS
jgi:hypothetical protein